MGRGISILFIEYRFPKFLVLIMYFLIIVTLKTEYNILIFNEIIVTNNINF